MSRGQREGSATKQRSAAASHASEHSRAAARAAAERGAHLRRRAERRSRWRCRLERAAEGVVCAAEAWRQHGCARRVRPRGRGAGGRRQRAVPRRKKCRALLRLAQRAARRATRRGAAAMLCARTCEGAKGRHGGGGERRGCRLGSRPGLLAGRRRGGRGARSEPPARLAGRATRAAANGRGARVLYAVAGGTHPAGPSFGRRKRHARAKRVPGIPQTRSAAMRRAALRHKQTMCGRRRRCLLTIDHQPRSIAASPTHHSCLSPCGARPFAFLDAFLGPKARLQSAANQNQLRPTKKTLMLSSK